MLSDKAPRTRLPSITFLRDVLNDPQAEITFIPGLRPFLERFRPRLLDIAKRDVDRKNREEAVQVVVEGAIMGVLGEEEETEEALLPLIVNESEVVRKTVARFFVHSWKAASEELAPEDSDSTTKTHAQLKSLAQTMSRAFQLASSRSDETLFTEEHVPLVGELGPYYKREVETSSLLSIEGVYRMSLAFEALAEADEWSGEVLQVGHQYSLATKVSRTNRFSLLVLVSYRTGRTFSDTCCKTSLSDSKLPTSGKVSSRRSFRRLLSAMRKRTQ